MAVLYLTASKPYGVLYCPLVLQVEGHEKGAMNGAADTVRTASTALGYPLMTTLFGYFISDRAPIEIPGASLYLGSLLVLVASMCLSAALKFHHHHHVN